NPFGVHILVAQEICKIRKKYRSRIFLKNENGMASAENVTQLLSLKIKQGDPVVVIVDGYPEREVMELVLSALQAEPQSP
ncbi:MAG: HPr family phosphocarrier protein, partial [Hespellia sp.]|nr:HPr family phosphocarrier protein [Hespellia sp.]